MCRLPCLHHSLLITVMSSRVWKPVRLSIEFKDSKTYKTVTMDVAATWKDPFNGTVQIDKKSSLGCGACADACPYDTRTLGDLSDTNSEVSKYVKKGARGLTSEAVQIGPSCR